MEGFLFTPLPLPPNLLGIPEVLQSELNALLTVSTLTDVP